METPLLSRHASEQNLVAGSYGSISGSLAGWLLPLHSLAEVSGGLVSHTLVHIDANGHEYSTPLIVVHPITPSFIIATACGAAGHTMMDGSHENNTIR